MRVILLLCFLLPACATGSEPIRNSKPVTVSTRAEGAWPKKMTSRCAKVQGLVAKKAKEYDVDPALVNGIIRVESRFNPKAVSRVGAKGLMQVMPSTAKGLRCGNLFQPEENIDCGIRVLRGFLRYYKQDLIYGVSGYNAGFRMPNRARKKSALPANIWYVERVLAARARFLRRGCGDS
jgi:soluble lytic murein transglycosylase-like protein